MEKLKNYLNEQIEILHNQGKQFLNKEISLHDFKKASGKFGIYAERGGQTFMIRIKIPSGVFNKESIEIVKSLIKNYKINSVHLSTRQAVQFHGLSLDAVISIFKETIEKNLIGFGCGGNFPRNVTSSPLSGVEKGEAFDVTPYANYATNYFLERMDTYVLPRKVKVGFSNGISNLSVATMTDLGFLATIKDDKKYFRVFIAGGLGKSPQVGAELPYLIEPTEILYYVDALVNLFKEHGNYENRNKARIRYILQEKGQEEFLSLYQQYVDKSKDLNLKVEEASETVIPSSQEGSIEENINVIAQKQEGRYTVIVKPVGGILASDDFAKVLDFVLSSECGKAILSMEESIYVNNLTCKEASNLLELCKTYNQTTRLSHSLSCIGVPVCQIGLAESQTLLKSILKHFEEKGLNKDLLPSIHISGCPNSCGRHQSVEIGFAGKRKMIDGAISDAYELHVGGSFAVDNAKLGDIICDIDAKKVPLFLEEVYTNLNAKGIEFSSFKSSDEFKSICEKYKI